MKNHLSQTTKSYDQIASIYAKRRFAKKRLESQKQMDDFVSLLPKKSGQIFDFGCGPGHHSAYLTNLGYMVTGNDISPQMIKIARKHAPKAKFICQDMFDTNFPPKTFIGIWAAASFIHLPKKQAQVMLSRLHKMLKKNGIIYISIKKGKGEKVDKKLKYGLAQEKFYSYYSPTEFSKLLKQNKYKVLKTYDWVAYNKVKWFAALAQVC